MSDPAPTLEELLVAHRGALVAFLSKEASGLFEFESAEDLAQGVHLRVLDAASYRHEGEAGFRAWLFTVARNHVAERNAYWRALKRGSARVLRLSMNQSTETTGVAAPPVPATGPSTFAERRELLMLATKALSSLPQRDADLVRWRSEGLSLGEQAERAGLSYAAAQRAGLRALDRFQRAFEIVLRASLQDGV